MNNWKRRFKIQYVLAIFLVAFHYHGNCQEVNPYDETGGAKSKNESTLVTVNTDEINVLSCDKALTGENLKTPLLNYMYVYSLSNGSGPYKLKWTVNAVENGTFDVAGMISGINAKITLFCNDQVMGDVLAPSGWNRVSLGKIELKKGINEIEIKIETDKPLKVSALELTRPKLKAEITEEALKQRVNADWFKDAGYGLMFQWTNRATPQTGNTIKDWNDKVNDFDMDYFINLVESSGAAYVVWSVTWGQQYISAPIKSLEKLIAGRTTERDLLGEMADRLAEKNIKLLFYYHYGYDCYHSKDSVWMQKADGYEADKTVLYQNVSNIVAELGERYGDKLNGWFFDGSQRYYDSHFDGSEEGILSASFKDLTASARTGNKQRIIAYNSWVLPMLTEYQDYFAGEGLGKYENLDQGIFSEGKNKGLMAHSCFTFEKDWGHIDWNTKIPPPKYTLETLVKLIRNAQENRYPYSINLEMYEDGTVSPQSYELLKKLKKEIRVE